jgi:hypothetical protein
MPSVSWVVCTAQNDSDPMRVRIQWSYSTFVQLAVSSNPSIARLKLSSGWAPLI